MRILAGNEPRSYREVIAAALHELRLHTAVIIVAPEDLDGAVASSGREKMHNAGATETKARAAGQDTVRRR